MRYKYNTDNLVASLRALADFIEKNRSDKEDKEFIEFVWDEFDGMLDKIESEYSDSLGTEGYEHNILGRD